MRKHLAPSTWQPLHAILATPISYCAKLRSSKAKRIAGAGPLATIHGKKASSFWESEMRKYVNPSWRVSKTMFLCLIFLVAAGITYGYFASENAGFTDSPASRYFYTAYYGNVIVTEVRHKKAINGPQPCESLLKVTEKITFYAEYRGVVLCNAARAFDIDLQNEIGKFKDSVDELWRRYYFSHARLILFGLLEGFFVWGLLLLAMSALRRIRQDDDY